MGDLAGDVERERKANHVLMGKVIKENNLSIKPVEWPVIQKVTQAEKDGIQRVDFTDTNTERVDDYAPLKDVLREAFEQASNGKGSERHANGEPITEQPIMWIEKYFKSFQLGQAVKKIHESQGMGKQAAIKELLGAINYIALHIITIKEV